MVSDFDRKEWKVFNLVGGNRNHILLKLINVCISYQNSNKFLLCKCISYIYIDSSYIFTFNLFRISHKFDIFHFCSLAG